MKKLISNPESNVQYKKGILRLKRSPKTNLPLTSHLPLPQIFLHSHLVGKGGGCPLLFIAGLTVFSSLIVALLAVVGLVASLGASVRVRLPITSLSIGIRGGLLLLGGLLAHKGCNDPGLLEYKPQVTCPQDQVEEAKDLERNRKLTMQFQI